MCCYFFQNIGMRCKVFQCFPDLGHFRIFPVNISSTSFLNSTLMAYLWDSCDLIPLSLNPWNPYQGNLLHRVHSYSIKNWEIICCLTSSYSDLLFMKRRYTGVSVEFFAIIFLESMMFYLSNPNSFTIVSSSKYTSVISLDVSQTVFFPVRGVLVMESKYLLVPVILLEYKKQFEFVCS